MRQRSRGKVVSRFSDTKLPLSDMIVSPSHIYNETTFLRQLLGRKGGKVSEIRAWLHLMVAGILGAWSLMFLVFFIIIHVSGQAVIAYENNLFIRTFEMGMTVTTFALAMFAVWDILRRE